MNQVLYFHSVYSSSAVKRASVLSQCQTGYTYSVCIYKLISTAVRSDQFLRHSTHNFKALRPKNIAHYQMSYVMCTLVIILLTKFDMFFSKMLVCFTIIFGFLSDVL